MDNTLDLEGICKACDYKPSRIGKEILRVLGYDIADYVYSPDIYVRDKEGRLVGWEEYD